MLENAPETPPSGKQRQASRRHGALSRGPATPAEFEAILAAYTAAFQPQDRVEFDCVHKMAFAKWREYRAWTTETGAFNMEVTREEENIDAEFSHFTEPVLTIDYHETRDSQLSLATFRFLQEYRKHLCRNSELQKIIFCEPNPSASATPDPEQ